MPLLALLLLPAVSAYNLHGPARMHSRRAASSVTMTVAEPNTAKYVLPEPPTPPSAKAQARTRRH